jgi:hypothetical protein
MVILNARWNFHRTNKKFRELAGLYYAAMFAYNQMNKRGTVLIVKTGEIYDMVIAPDVVSSNTQVIRKRGERFVEVKGSKNVNPPSVPVCRTVEDLPTQIFPQKYFVYVVYNLVLHKKPGIAILDPNYLHRFAKITRHELTIHLLGVNKDARKGIIKNYRDVFDVITVTKKKEIFNSFRDGKICVHERIQSTPIMPINEYTRSEERYKPLLSDKLNMIESENVAKSAKQTRHEFINQELKSYLKSLNTGQDFRIGDFIKVKQAEGAIKIRGSQNDWSAYKIIYKGVSMSYSVLWHDVRDAVLAAGFKKGRQGIYKRR